MKKVYFIFCLLFSLTATKAQIYEVSMGENYRNQTYINLENGETMTISNTSWDIAFANQGRSVSILLNESAASDPSGPDANNELKLYRLQEPNWDVSMNEINQLSDSSRLYNSKIDYDQGAFVSARNPENVFDFGWGTYNPVTHAVEGSRVFILQQRNAEILKLRIHSFSGGAFIFEYGLVGDSTSIIDTVVQDTGTNAPFIYYSLKDQTVIESPSNYDLSFQRYFDLVYNYETGESIPYLVSGVLLGHGIEAAKTSSYRFEEKVQDTSVLEFSSHINVIGWDWKSYDFNQMAYNIADTIVYFIAKDDGSLFKLRFLDFEGSATGTTTIEVEKIDLTTSTKQVFSQNLLDLYPNPVSHTLFIKYDNTTSLKLEIRDLLGKVVYRNGEFVGNQLQIDHLNPGTYFLRTQIQDRLLVKPFVIN